MQYQVFVKSKSDKHFTASVMGMPAIAVDGDTEAEAIANAKTALETQLAMGKIVTISVEPQTSSIPSMQYGRNNPVLVERLQNNSIVLTTTAINIEEQLRGRLSQVAEAKDRAVLLCE